MLIAEGLDWMIFEGPFQLKLFCGSVKNRRAQGGSREQVPPRGVRFHLPGKKGSQYHPSVLITRNYLGEMVVGKKDSRYSQGKSA